MPKGEHFRKYPSKEKLDAQLNIHLNSQLLETFRQITEHPQEWIRNQIRKKVATSLKKRRINAKRFTQTHLQINDKIKCERA